MADQRTVPNNQIKTAASARGLERFSTSTLPVVKKMTAVARPIKRGYSERMKATKPFLLRAADLAACGAGMGRTISRATGRRNHWVGAPVGARASLGAKQARRTPAFPVFGKRLFRRRVRSRARSPERGAYLSVSAVDCDLASPALIRLWLVSLPAAIARDRARRGSANPGAKKSQLTTDE